MGPKTTLVVSYSMFPAFLLLPFLFLLWNFEFSEGHAHCSQSRAIARPSRSPDSIIMAWVTTLHCPRS